MDGRGYGKENPGNRLVSPISRLLIPSKLPKILRPNLHPLSSRESDGLVKKPQKGLARKIPETPRTIFRSFPLLFRTKSLYSSIPIDRYMPLWHRIASRSGSGGIIMCEGAYYSDDISPEESEMLEELFRRLRYDIEELTSSPPIPSPQDTDSL